MPMNKYFIYHKEEGVVEVTIYNDYTDGVYLLRGVLPPHKLYKANSINSLYFTKAEATYAGIYYIVKDMQDRGEDLEDKEIKDKLYKLIQTLEINKPLDKISVESC